jgi:hypothetical protein
MTNETKQTAVEWIEHQVEQQGITHYFSLREILQQAKEMEKEQIIKAIDSNYTYNDNQILTIGEQYYNETYGGNK